MAVDIEALITNSIERNEEFQDAAIRASRDVMTAASSRITGFTGYIATTPTLRENPPVFSPNSDLSVDFRNAYQEAFADFDPKVLEAVTDYLARFFPAAVATVCDDWIQDTIVNGGTGIPAAIEDAIWQRARARDTKESLRMEQEAVNQFAGRGFTMPSGVIAARLLEIQQEAANKSSTLNRDVAIKQAEIEVENIKFAIEQGLRVRLGVIAGVGSYINAWLKPAEEAVEYGKAVAQAKDRLWNQAADYYRAMIQEAALNLEAQKITQVSRDQNTNFELESFMKFVDSQVRAAMAVAETLGQAAAGALNATGTQVGEQVQRVGAAIA